MISAIDSCMSRPCQNGGTCIDQAGYYTCVCTPSWTGTNCEVGKMAMHFLRLIRFCTPFLCNGVHASRMCVRSLVRRPFFRPSFAKYTIVYREQTAGLSSSNFCTRMQVENFAYANLYPKLSTSLTFI